MRKINGEILGDEIINHPYVKALEAECSTLKMQNNLLLRELKDEREEKVDWSATIILFLLGVIFIEGCIIIALYYK